MHYKKVGPAFCDTKQESFLIPRQKSPGFNPWDESRTFAKVRDECNCAISAQEEAAGFSLQSFTFEFLKSLPS
jgi:hypothetical protein